MKKLFLLILLSVLGFSPILTGEADTVKLNINEYTLKNGMKVIILERHTAPTVGVTIAFKVGSANEKPGITGISHIIEHLIAGKGTQKIGTKDYQGEKKILDKMDTLYEKINALRAKIASQPPDETSIEKQELKSLESELADLKTKAMTYRIVDEDSMIYKRHGSVGNNASTSEEITNYYCELPANKLELWAWLESDRFKNPVWRDFWEEKDVIMEERRMRSEASPRGVLYEKFKALCYQVHPLRWPIIGSMTDIQSITKDQVKEYFHQYYSPNNAVAVIVGDVDSEKTLELVKKYFESIPPSPKPVPQMTVIEPKQEEERRLKIELDSQPMMLIGHHTVTIGHKDDYILDIVSCILGGGRTSRLFKSLVLDKNLCTTVYGYNDVGKYAGLFIFGAMPRHPHTPEEVEQAIYEEIEKLKNDVTDEEIIKAKKNLSANFLRQLDNNLGMAQLLGHYEAIYSWKYISEVKARWDAVTQEDVKEVISKYFVSTNKNVAVLVTKKSQKPGEDKKE